MRSNEILTRFSSKDPLPIASVADRTELLLAGSIQIWVLWGEPKGCLKSRIPFLQQKCLFFAID